MKSTGNLIQERREALGMSRDTLAEKLGFKTRMTVWRIETGKRSLRLSEFPRVAKALGTTVPKLFGVTAAVAKMLEVA